MPFPGPHPSEEKTLETFFDFRNFTPGGFADTNQLKDACCAVQQFIAQESCGNLDIPAYDDLWIHFQAILIRILGKQDGASAGQAGEGTSGGYSGSLQEHSWMFAATSFYYVQDARSHLAGSRAELDHRRAGAARAGDPRLYDMAPSALPLLSLLMARPPERSLPSGTKNLFAVLLEPQKVWYTFSCACPPMPPQTVAFLGRGAPPDAVLLENSRLYTHCLSSPPSLFPPQGAMQRHGVRFEDLPGGGVAEGNMVLREGAGPVPDLRLSTLEFFLFSFAWYALSSRNDFYHGLLGAGRPPPVPQDANHQGGGYRPERVALGWRRRGVKGLTMRNPYMTLLQDYVEAFFPHGDGVRSVGEAGGGGSGGMSLQCELFLRVLVEFWLESNAVLRPGVPREVADQQRAQMQQQQQQQQQGQEVQAWGYGGNGHAPAIMAPPPATAATQAAWTTMARAATTFDPTLPVLGTTFTTPTDMVLHGLLVVSAHLLADPRLRETCRCRGGIPAAGRAGGSVPSGPPPPTATTTTTTTMGGGGSADMSGAGGRGWGATVLTPALEVLRPHVFGFLRVIFSPESSSAMHTSSPVFALAVELWILWMRPWAARAILRGGSPDVTAVSAGAPGLGYGGHHGRSNTFHAAPAAMRGGGEGQQGGGAGAGSDWVSWAVAGFKEFMQIEPSGESASSTGGGRGGNSRRGAHFGSVQGPGAGAGGGGGAGGGVDGDGYSYGVWGGWVLENYSLYTTLLAGFVRKAGGMSFKTNRAAVGSLGRGGGGGGVGGGGVYDSSAFLFGDPGGANLALLYRVTEVFSPGVRSLLAAAQNTVSKQKTKGGSGGDGAGAGGGAAGEEGLGDEECEVLQTGRLALSSIQGPDLVVLSRYQDVAVELLITLSDLANPRVSNDWMDKMMHWGSGPSPGKATVRARAISRKVKELFGLPSDWKPRDQGRGAGAGGGVALADMFHPDREKHAPFYLSRQGKADITSGRRVCKPWDVAYVGDPMYHPQRSWELQVLIVFWVGVSEYVNTRYIGWTSPHGYDAEEEDSHRDDSVLFGDEGSSETVLRGEEFQRRVWREGRWASLPRRVNLRCLADVRATLALASAVLLVGLLSYYLSLNVGAIFATLLAALVFRLSTMDVD